MALVSIIYYIKIIKLLLVGDVEGKIHDYLKNKLDTKNVLNFYQLANLFNLSSTAKAAFIYLELRFTVVAETQSFLELDYNSVSKILESSGLLITSELEVYNAANKWLSYNFKKRSKFNKNLLRKVRLHLLSDKTLRFLLNNSSSFTDNDACVAMIEGILDNKDKFIQSNCNSYSSNRHCDQDGFDILICGGYDLGGRRGRVINTVNQIDGKKFEKRQQKVLRPLIEERQKSKAVSLRGEVYMFGG